MPEVNLHDFLNELASAAPAPGGGAVAALSAAMAAALLAMVCHLTIGKKGYENLTGDLEQTLERSEEMRQKCFGLMKADQEAFSCAIHAFKLPKTTAGETESRKREIEKAFQEAARVPLELGGRCLDILNLASTLAEKANRSVISDVGVGAIMARAALEAATTNVQVNLPYIKDRGFIDQCRQSNVQMLETGRLLYTDVQEKVYQQIQ